MGLQEKKIQEKVERLTKESIIVVLRNSNDRRIKEERRNIFLIKLVFNRS